MQVSGHYVLAQALAVPDYEAARAAVSGGHPVMIGLACYCDYVESYATIELGNVREVRRLDDGYEFTGDYFAAEVHTDCSDRVVGLLTSARGVCHIRVCARTGSVDINFRVHMSFAVVE